MARELHTSIVFVPVHHGNTERVARTIAEELEADLLSLDAAKAAKPAAYDLPRTEGKKAFVSSTSGKGKNELNSF